MNPREFITFTVVTLVLFEVMGTIGYMVTGFSKWGLSRLPMVLATILVIHLFAVFWMLREQAKRNRDEPEEKLKNDWEEKPKRHMLTDDGELLEVIEDEPAFSSHNRA